MRHTLSFVTLTGITFLNLLIGLPTWMGAMAWGAMHKLRAGEILTTINDAPEATRDAALLIGSAIVLLLMAALLLAAGAIIARQWKLVPYGLLVPLHWILPCGVRFGSLCSGLLVGRKQLTALEVFQKR